MITGDKKDIINWLLNQEDNKIYEIKEKRKNRTLTQNAYAWELITQLANLMRISKEELYIKMLEEYGQSTLVSVKSSIDFRSFMKYYKEVGRSILNDIEFTHYKVYKGSSQFDTYEMSIFIDGIIHECENVGIPTLTKKQIENLKVV